MRIPLIDDIGVIPFSKKKVYTKLPRREPIFSEAIIGELAGMLTRCNWVNDLDHGFSAGGTISYPLGFTFATAMASGGDVGCGPSWISLSFKGITTARYSSYTPGQTPHEGGNCFMFALGFTAFGSLSNLALRITNTSPFNATAGIDSGGRMRIDLSAKEPGPQLDYWTVTADGRYGIGIDGTVGGGYRFQCIGNDPPETIYEVWARAMTQPALPNPVECVEFTFVLNKNADQRKVVYNLVCDSNSPYFKMVANPYSFALWDDTNEFGNIAAFTPCIPTNEGFQPAYAVCVVGPGNLPTKLQWDGYRAPCTVCLDGPAQTFGDALTPSGPGVPALRTAIGGRTFTSLEKKPFSHAAYLQMGRFRGDPARLVGKLWDCMVVTDVVPEEVQIAKRNYVRISASSGGGGYTRGSLVFCVDDNGEPTGGSSGSGGGTDTGSTGGGGGGTSSGGGNGSKTGTCHCYNGVDIVYDTGDKFDSSMIGQTLTITGIPGTGHPWVPDSTDSLPVVATIVSPTELTTTHSLNASFLGANFTCP